MSLDPIVENSPPQAIGLLTRRRWDYHDKGCLEPVFQDDGVFALRFSTLRPLSGVP
ncbi:MAG: hypothetical protein LBR53_11800 [Deltaproteobacteria bacterium]|jgi:hypothetical protein|nr:hypothetical protein [Deltaproteobacteria bacterium]